MAETKYKERKTFDVMQYFDYMDTDFNGVVDRIKSIQGLRRWSVALHDKDKLEDGVTLKRPHFHAVLCFDDGKTFATVGKLMHVDPQYVNKIDKTTAQAEEYLCHQNAPEKFQYDSKEVVASYDYVAFCLKQKEKRERFDTEKHVYDLIASEQIKPYNVYDRISVEFYAKNKAKILNAFECVVNKKRGLERDMKCIYLFGKSGNGKTTLAKMYAARMGYHAYVASGGKNPLDDYKGEECIILDELRGDTFKLADFLKLTDNNTDSLIGCRYYNKSISYCKMIICTSVKSIPELFEETKSGDEEIKQLYRRFSAGIVEVNRENLVFYTYDEKQNVLVWSAEMVNPVSAMFDAQIAKETAQGFANVLGLKINKDISTIKDDGEFVPF